MNQITKLEEANIRGLRLIPEASRHYPNGRLAAHVLGFVGIDNKGLLGLESSFDAVLSGEKASVVLAKDARGKNLYSTGATPSVPGQSLRLTIDQVIQGYATTALAKGMKDSGSKRGFVIVSDPHTGKILAMVSFPDFDPNSASLSDLETTRNLATNWQFEPGSVIKPLVLALALEQKAVFRQSEYDCEKSGKFEVSPRVFIHDTHPNPLLTPSGILEQSSNICTFKFAQLIGKQGLFDGYANFGLNASFSLPLPGYNRSELPAYNSWSPIKFANISFGQGMLSTGIEMAQAFNTLINGGLLMQPLLVESIQGYDGGIIRQEDPEVLRRVISDETSNIMRELLQASVERGTGKRARVKGQTIGGKTGTTEKIDPQTKSYSSEMRIASFIGFAPVVDPHFSIYVVLDEPSIRPYYGGVWAAPVFAEIAEKTMLYLNVPSLTTWPAPGA
jgi:cell division protein FtsI (penicillin-binding protein 3)